MQSIQSVRLTIRSDTGMIIIKTLVIDPDTLSEQVSSIGSQIVDILSILLRTGSDEVNE